MKQIITNGSGGIKQFGPQNVGEHYILLQDQTIEVLKSVMHSLGAVDNTKVYVLSGLKMIVSGSLDVYQSGVVYYSGEVFYVNESTFPNNTTDIGLSIVETDPTGLVQFSDLSLSSIHVERKMQWLEQGSFQPDADFLNIEDVLRGHLGFSEWVDVIDKAIPDSVSVVNGFTRPIMCRKDVDVLRVRGCGRDFITANSVLFRLPVGYRPSKTVVFPLACSQPWGESFELFMYNHNNHSIEPLFTTTDQAIIYFDFSMSL